jgi:hypothetical protein
MAKKPHNIKLQGILPDGHIAKTSDADQVSAFVSIDRKVSVVIRPDRAFLRTPKGHYQLTKHKSANRYQGIVEGNKTHITTKLIVGKVIWWA